MRAYESEEGEAYEEGKTLPQLLKQYWYYILAVVLYLFFSGKWGTFIWDKASVVAMGIVLAAWLIGYEAMQWKFNSPKVIADPVWSSVNLKTFKECGNWGMVKMGGVDWGFSMEGNEGTIIAPLTAFNTVGRNMAIPVYVMPVDKNELPGDVRERIEREKWPTPYFWGLSGSKLSQPELSYLSKEIRNLNRMNAFLCSQIDEKGDVLEKSLRRSKRMVDTAQGSTWDKMKSMIRKEEE